MIKIGFIGSYDKTDSIIYVAKILTMLDKKVLVIDTTINQKAKYVVPVINPTMCYVTEFEGIDIAVGFKDEATIKRYLGLQESDKMEYDIVLVDADNVQAIIEFGLRDADKNYFVTSFDLFSLKKGLEILNTLPEPLQMTKMLFSKDMLKEEDEYLDFLSRDSQVRWSDYKIYFPITIEDLNVIAENQRVEKIKFKKLSEAYKDSLQYVAEEIAKDVSANEIRKAIKNIEKGA